MHICTKHVLQLKGNLMLTHGQWFQYSNVLLVVLIMSMLVPIWISFKNNVSVVCMSVLRISTNVVHYQAYDA